VVLIMRYLWYTSLVPSSDHLGVHSRSGSGCGGSGVCAGWWCRVRVRVCMRLVRPSGRWGRCGPKANFGYTVAEGDTSRGCWTPGAVHQRHAGPCRALSTRGRVRHWVHADRTAAPIHVVVRITKTSHRNLNS